MKKRTGIILIILYGIIQLLTLPHVGFTWDEPSIYFIGKRNRDFWQTFQVGKIPDYSQPIQAGDGKLRLVWGAMYYPPLIPTLASFTSGVVTDTLHIASFVTGYHIILVIIGTAGVLALYGIGLTVGFSPLIATGVALSYALYPTIVGQMRNDAKDVPVAGAISVLMYCVLKLFASWRTHHKQILWIILSGIAFGFAILIKPTAAIMAPIVIIFFLLALLFPHFRKHIPNVPLLILTPILAGLISMMVILSLWPWLWDDPVGKIMQTIAFFQKVGYLIPVLYFGKIYQAGINLPKLYPLGIFVVQTPIPILFLFFVGIIGALWKTWKTKNPLPILFIVWFVMGIVRFFLPGVLIYAKMRHLIDVVPAVFILLGFGVEWISSFRVSRLAERFVKVIFGIIILHELVIILVLFPYEPSYFNAFVGGISGVAKNKLFDAEYWGSSTKEGIAYIDAHTTTPVSVYTCSMAHMAKYYETEKVKVSKVPQGTQYMLIPNSASYFITIYDQMNIKNDLVYTVTRNGADLLYIFKLGITPFPACARESEDDI